jgi:hypothetical protein
MKLLPILALAVAAVACTGCIKRQITILSTPEGALVELNHQEVGRTPVTVSFEWYGDYEITLRYEREELNAQGKMERKVYYLHTHEEAKAPPHQWIGVDFFTEVLPFKFEDHKTWAYVVPQLPPASDADMVERGAELKGRLDDPIPFRRPD